MREILKKVKGFLKKIKDCVIRFFKTCWKQTVIGFSLCITLSIAIFGMVLCLKPLEEVEAKDSTCTVAGNLQYWKNTITGACFKDEDGKHKFKDESEYMLPLLAHNATYTAAKVATCTQSGNREYWHCIVCEKNFTDEACKNQLTVLPVIEATGHKEVIDNAVAPTCTTNGKTEGKHCSVCSAVIIAQQDTPFTGHAFTQEKAEGLYLKTAADCTHKAVYYKSCTVCGEKGTETFEYGTTGVHTFTQEKAEELYLKTAADCTHGAVYYKSCAVCNVKGTDTFEYGEPKGHSEVIDNAVPATCTTNGKTEGKHCSVCSAVIIAQQDTPFTGHAFTQEKVATKYLKTAANCTDKAIYFKSCTVCGEKGADTFEYGEPKGHTWSDNVCSACEFDAGGSKGLSWKINSDKTAYTLYDIANCAETEITVPSTYNGLPVTSIGEYAFSGRSNLTGITVSEGVTSIGNKAFYGCSGLTKIALPDSITSIGSDAFYGCSGIIQTENGVSYLDKWLISCDISTTSVDIRKDTTKIIESAFVNCVNMTSITIPDGVIFIYDEAFSGCSGLTSIIIGNGVTFIGTNVFSGCSGLTSITVGNNNTNYTSQDGILYDKSKTSIVYVPKAISGAVTIPDGVTTIGNKAFSDCGGLTSITLPDSVTTIGNEAFYNCRGLASINIPDGVTSIGEMAFYYCSALTSITLPDSVTSVGGGLFYYCSKLATVKLSNNITSLPCYYINYSYYGFFQNCYALTSVTIPDGVTTIGRRAFSSCYGLTSINIPDGVTSIGERAFSYCSGLTNITIPDIVTSIGEDAFYRCNGIIQTENGVEYVDKWIVDCDTSLTSVHLRADTKGIAGNAFYGCDKLTAVYYEGDIAGGCAVKGLGNIMSSGKTLYIDGKEIVGELIIPEEVTFIGSYAFSYCQGLRSVTIGNGVTSIGDHAFYNCSRLANVTIGDSVTIIDSYAFYNCSGLTSITIPDSVTLISEWAFYYCSGLTSVTIGNGVTSIGNWAFSGCSNLKDINFNGTKEQWQAIDKGSYWNSSTGNYTVHCTDGDVKK